MATPHGDPNNPVGFAAEPAAGAVAGAMIGLIDMVRAEPVAPHLALWFTLADQITANNIVIGMTLQTFDALRPEECIWIHQAYTQIVGGSAVYVRDFYEERIFLGRQDCFPAYGLRLREDSIPLLIDHGSVNWAGDEHVVAAEAAFQVTQVAPVANTVNDAANDAVEPVNQERVPRPANAFILYRQEKHGGIRAMNPDMHNNDISVIIGRMWHAESQAVKDAFKERARVVKALHSQQNPNYSYRPRRPHERKRRMTRKRKLEAMMLADATVATALADNYPPAQFQNVIGANANQHSLVLPAQDDVVQLIEAHDAASGYRDIVVPELAASQQFLETTVEDYGLIDWSTVRVNGANEISMVADLIEQDGTVNLGIIQSGAHNWR